VRWLVLPFRGVRGVCGGLRLYRQVLFKNTIPQMKWIFLLMDNHLTATLANQFFLLLPEISKLKYLEKKYISFIFADYGFFDWVWL